MHTYCSGKIHLTLCFLYLFDLGMETECKETAKIDKRKNKNKRKFEADNNNKNYKNNKNENLAR